MIQMHVMLIHIVVVEIRVKSWSTMFEDRTLYRLLIVVQLKMYSKLGQPKSVLVGQMLKLVGKWPMADCYF